MSATSRRIIGIDPGSRATGYGIIEQGKNGTVSCLGWGVIRTDPEQSFPDRLFRIHRELSEVIRCHAPDEAVVEKVFMAKNAASALKLGQARGVVILTCRIHDVPVFEYSATEIKASVTGYGAASKEQVAGMVGQLLGIRGKLPTDATDALAMAFCGATTNRFGRMTSA